MNVINEVLILFILMFAGFMARRSGVIDAPFNRGLSRLILDVTMPLMILAAFNISFDPSVLKTAGIVFTASMIAHIAIFLASGLLYRNIDGSGRDVLRFSAVFSNCAFMGYPVLDSIYGKSGVFYASIFTVPFIMGLWTIGVYLFQARGTEAAAWKKVLYNPGIIAVFVGILLFISQFKLPYPLLKSCELLGSATTPLAMILIGSALAEIPLKELLGGRLVYFASFIRLVLIPLSAFAFLYSLGVRGVALGVIVISLGMPVAANTAAFAERFGADAALASRCVFVSTLFSVLTIPALITVLQSVAGK